VTLFLGVDGGGTKTAFVLIDQSGARLARSAQPTSYYLESGHDRVVQVLADGLEAVCAAAGVSAADISYAFLGLPAYGEIRADSAILSAAPAGVLGHRRYRVDNDMVAGWAGSLGGEDGINVIAGTGSMTYGERAGRGNRVGGWGTLFGDEGSGYWIGRQGLNAFSRQSDGRSPRGPLHEAVRQRTGITSDLEVLDVVINRWRQSRTQIAALAPTVLAAAEAGDPLAEAILNEAIAHLTELVVTTRRNLGFAPGETVAVSHSGGLFNADRIRTGLAAGLAEGSDAYDLRAPLLDPATGAALYAARLAGSPLSPEALARLRA
jgi:N-acetylglucosamine kinase-like BadF-type ATPase